MFLDNSLALILGKRSAVHITDLVGLAVSPAGRDAGQQGGGDVAHGRIVVPFGDHQPLVLGGQLRVELARLFGGHPQGFAEQLVAGLGQPCRVVGGAGLVHLRDEPGVGADGGEAGEPVRVAEPGGDDGGDGRGGAGR